jgi:ubiquinone/menaquinone biosynthesis C-methylase UbiE
MYFNGLCMMPNESWHAKMEIEHWVRYTTFLSAARGKKILDIASGEGYGADLLASVAGHVTGIDISSENVEHARAKYCDERTNLCFSIGDASGDLSLPEKSFDLVTSFETFEHVLEQDKMLSNLEKVLKDDGVLLLSTPKPNLNVFTGKPNNPHHTRELSLGEFLPLIQKYFKHVLVCGQFDSYPFDVHQEHVERDDRYILTVASMSLEKARDVFALAMPLAVATQRVSLSARHLASLKFQPRPPRVIFVPLNPSDRKNPSDRRRTEIIRNCFMEFGVDCAIMPKEQAVHTGSDLIISQDRDYGFWNQNSHLLKKTAGN